MRWVAWSRSGISSGRNGGSSSRARLGALVGLLLALNGALLVLLGRPPGQSLVERQQELEQARGRHQETLSSVEQMRELRSKLQAAIQNGREFSQKSFLPRQTAFSAMLTDLEKLASESRLRPAGVGYRLRDLTDQPGWVNVEVTLTLEGEYSDLVQFINRLEQSKLFWVIDNMNVSGSPTRPLRLNLQVGTYIAPS